VCKHWNQMTLDWRGWSSIVGVKKIRYLYLFIYWRGYDIHTSWYDGYGEIIVQCQERMVITILNWLTNRGVTSKNDNVLLWRFPKSWGYPSPHPVVDELDDHVSIETHGDLEIPHFQKPPFFGAPFRPPFFNLGCTLQDGAPSALRRFINPITKWGPLDS